jgi:hypothetical protein
MTLDANDLLCQVDGACAPHLKAVDPLVVLRRREEGYILAQTGDGAALLREGDAICVERDLLPIVRCDLRVNVQVESAVCAHPQVVDSGDLALELRSD